jgi:uncharacterized membrane protein
LIRCRACGYLMKEGKLGDKCPACGAPKTSFEPYNDLMAEPRRRVLNFQLHPIAAHFPVAFTVATLVFILASTFLRGEAQNLVISTSKVLVLFMPLLVILTFIVGWIDGKIRFRKIANSKILKTKILYACLLFAVSLALTIVVWMGAFNSVAMTVLALLLNAAALVLIFLLGLLGTSIIGAAFPGK